VENGVKESHRVREFESVRVVGDLPLNLERTESFVIEFLRRSKGLDVLRIEPYESSFFELFGNGGPMSVGRELSLRLGDSHLFATIVVEFGKGSREVVSVRVSNGDIERQSSSRVVTIVGEERGDLSSGMRGIVICKFCDRKEIGPIVLLVVAIEAEVGFKGLVRSFGLTITLRVICSRELEFHIEELG
jgi:hypothetical protein